MMFGAPGESIPDRLLETRFPVSGFPLAVGDGYDAHCIGIVEVDDGKRKAAKHETPGSVQVFGPALGRLHNVADHVGYGYTKFRCYGWAPAAVPTDRFPEILPCLWVKPEPLTSHQGTL